MTEKLYKTSILNQALFICVYVSGAGGGEATLSSCFSIFWVPMKAHMSLVVAQEVRGEDSSS